MDMKFLNKVRQDILLGMIDVSNTILLRRIEKTVIESKDINLIRLFAQKVDGANVPLLEEVICSEYKKVMFRDFSDNTSLVLSEFVLFAKLVKGANVRRMEHIIMSDEPINEVARYLFATQVSGANTRLLLSKVNPENAIRIQKTLIKKEESKPHYEYIAPKSK